MLLGLASSGPHSNGYSLIRKIIEVSEESLMQDLNGQPLVDALMAPTRIYVKSLLELFTQVEVKALSHITGGGLVENLPRVLPANTCARVNTSTWQRPAVFDWLEDRGNVDYIEMHRTFNCGIGMVLVVDPKDQAKTIEILQFLGEQVSVIGEIKSTDQAEPFVELVSE